MICARIMLKGAKEPVAVKSVLLLNESDLNIAVRFQLRNELLENVNDFLQV